MLNRLKRADRTAERSARFRVFDRYLEISLDETDLISTFENRSAIREGVEICDVDDVIFRDADTIENNFGELLSGHRVERHDSNALCGARHRSHHEAALASCDYPDHIGHLRIGNEQLRPAQHHTLAGALCLERDVTGAPSAGGLRKGVGVDLRSIRNRRKIFLVL